MSQVTARLPAGVPGRREQPRRSQVTSQPGSWWGNTTFLVSFVILLAAWQLSGQFLNKIFLSTPSAIIADFVLILGKGVLITAFLGSAWEMLIGTFIAALVGIGLGVLMARSRLAGTTLEPLINFANATPTIALLPLMEIWFGLGMTARVAFIVLISIWTILINTLVGVKNVSRGYADVGAAFGLRGWSATRFIFIPAAMPYILAGMRIALAQAAVGMILSGQEVGEAGLGGLTEVYGTYYQTGHLVAAIITSTGLALVAFGLLKLFQAKRYSWIAASAANRR